MEIYTQWLREGDSDTRTGFRVLLRQNGKVAEIGRCMASPESDGEQNVMARALEKAAAWLRAGEVDLRYTGATVART